MSMTCSECDTRVHHVNGQWLDAYEDVTCSRTGRPHSTETGTPVGGEMPKEQKTLSSLAPIQLGVLIESLLQHASALEQAVSQAKSREEHVRSTVNAHQARRLLELARKL